MSDESESKEEVEVGEADYITVRGDLVKPEQQAIADAPREEEREETKPAEPPKKAEKVACEDCGRLVSPKTLRYSHRYQCKARGAPEGTARVRTAPPPPPPVESRPRHRYSHISLLG